MLLMAYCLAIGTLYAQQRPNVLWVVIEDTSPQFIGCYGDSSARTPAIDKLARGGIRFSNAFATGTVCSPSRSAIITGARTYEMGTGNHRSNYAIPTFIKGFPSYLRQAGYYTSNNKKTDYNTSAAKRLTTESWDESSGEAGWWNRKPGQPFFAVFNFDDSHQSRTMTNPYQLYTKQVLDELPADRRVAEKEVHVPPFFRDSDSMRKQLARIYNGISLADYKLGKIIDRLENDHLLDSTIIFFYADHGEGMPRAKTNGIDLGFRAPLVIWFPEMYKGLSPWGTGGVVTADLVNFADFAPTLLQLAGAPIPEYMHGRALLGKDAASAPKQMLLTSDGAEGVTELCRTITDGRFTYSRVFMPFMPELFYKKYFDYSEIMQQMRADLKNNLLDNTQKHLFETRQTEYLFDYNNDPWQLHNLAQDPQYQSMLEEMRKKMKSDIIRNRDVMFLPEYELGQISKTGTPYEFRQNDLEYPIADIYQAAALSGIRTNNALKKQVELLKHSNRFVRYWAALGLKSQGEAVKKYSRQLKDALKDEYAPVKIVVASVLYDQTRDDMAGNILKEVIETGKPFLTRLAIQMVQYQQNRDAFVPAVQQLLNEIAQKKKAADAREPAELFMYSVKNVPLKYETFW